MPEERRKWFVMRIFSGVVAAALIAFAGVAWAAEPVSRGTADAAFEQGVAAYNAGRYAAAVPALTRAAATGDDTAKFFAEFYLARIYSDTTSGQTNHAKAFMLYRKLADEHADIDPEADHRAPFVAKALIVLAGYTKNGLGDLNLAANPRRAASYLHHAALFFGDKEAQLELAKLYLSGDSTHDDVRRGLHYLSTLSEQSYPAAQALLAEQLWIGEHVKVDQRRALALITMAVETAPAHDRIWIEETYHSMFCAASHETRREADGLMVRWRKMFTRPAAELSERVGLGDRELLPERQCANGETVAIRRSSVPVAAATPAAPQARAEAVVKGSTLSLGYRSASGPEPVAIKK
jgi:exopolysaccharide production negative regulator